jgi:hypothetical protein
MIFHPCDLVTCCTALAVISPSESRVYFHHGRTNPAWRGSNSQCPCLRAFDSWREHGRWQTRQLQTETWVRRNLPRFGPRRVKTYILLVWSYIASTVGAVTMVRRWELAMVEKRRVLAYTWGRWDLCEIRCIYPSWPPLLALIWGEVSGSGPSRLEVITNPN